MRKLSVVMVAAMLLTAGSIFASDPEKPKSEKGLSYQVWKLLKDNRIEVAEDEDLQAEILITINEDNEIVVIKVDSEDQKLDRFVKARLNYKKVDFTPLEKGKRYIIPLRITA
ncbi:hypothetical protein [Poritiphilus flavus]|uniref:Uncharacterized protein n=1 Tax=Poritiphilus flavus TaxID=2697053 RepID=A0A6L9E926_9FLAO|nr:hypothetical protein [Poritiphilus flavus]NAS11255.1 hypothetical protein [Poritiphilus flavus]